MIAKLVFKSKGSKKNDISHRSSAFFLSQLFASPRRQECLRSYHAVYRWAAFLPAPQCLIEKQDAYKRNFPKMVRNHLGVPDKSLTFALKKDYNRFSMITVTLILASVLTLLAISIHFFIFYLEVPAFGTDKFQQTFKTKSEDHPTLRAPFNNLGIYNGSIAVMTLTGLTALLAATLLQPQCSATLSGWASGMMTCGLAIMFCAGAYLFLTSPDKRRAACIQALPPLLALILWIIYFCG